MFNFSLAWKKWTFSDKWNADDDDSLGMHHDSKWVKMMILWVTDDRIQLGMMMTPWVNDDCLGWRQWFPGYDDDSLGDDDDSLGDDDDSPPDGA